MCLEVVDGALAAVNAAWKATLADADTTARCTVAGPGTYVVGQINYTPSSPSSPSSSPPLSSTAPLPVPQAVGDCSDPSVCVPLMSATLLGVGGMAGCEVGGDM